MSDIGITEEITELRFTSADGYRVYLSRKQQSDGTLTIDVWSLDNPLGVTVATFTDDQLDQAKTAAAALLYAKEQAMTLRTQADQLEATAAANIVESARVKPMPEPMPPVIEPPGVATP